MSEDIGTSRTNETQIQIISQSSSSSSDNSFKDDNGGGVLGVFGGMWLNVNLMIGSGIYATPGLIMKLTNSGGMTLVLYVIGFFYVLVGSFIYVELGSTISESGGEQIYFEKTFPNPKKMMAYIFSFSTIVLARPISIVSISIAGSQYIYKAIQINSHNKSAIEDIHNIEFWEIRFIAFGIISIITIYHLFSNKVAVWMNQILAVIKVSTLLTVVIIGLIRIKKYPERLSFNYLFSNARGIEYYNNYVSSMLKVLFAYSGWNALNYSLDEMRNPKKRLRISNPASVLIVGILYCLTILALIVTIPEIFKYSDDPVKVSRNSTDNPVKVPGNSTDDHVKVPGNSTDDPVTMSAKLGEEIGSGIAIAILIAISCFGAAGSGIWAYSRLIASVAKAGFIPKFSPVLQIFDERWNTPFNALIFQWCYLTMILLCTPLKNPYEVLVNTAQNTNIIFYFLCAIGLLVLRSTEPERKHNLPYNDHKKMKFSSLDSSHQGASNGNNLMPLKLLEDKLLHIFYAPIIYTYHQNYEFLQLTHGSRIKLTMELAERVKYKYNIYMDSQSSNDDNEWRNDLGITIEERVGSKYILKRRFLIPKKWWRIFSVLAQLFSQNHSVLFPSVLPNISITQFIMENLVYSNLELYQLLLFISNKVAVWINQILAFIKVSTVLTVVLFAYSGWNTLNYEMRHPRKRLRISNPASVLIVGILYCLAILSFLVTVSDSVKVPGNFMDDPVTMSAKLGDKIGLRIAIAILIAISCFGAVGVLFNHDPVTIIIFVGTFFPKPDSKNYIERFNYILFYIIIIFGLICWYLVYYRPRRNSNSTPPEM
ncbi:hypothetical protein Glove_144g102 [Diversispora epigaea]|uniref:Amino acid permease/ SLC12A domain-containing protein n=1 Tax=Diversispora epigaea TaxID=1348612 RepID=A0A397J3L1_9GLOM|nr:hypothetical protein Glove_144g102 [Diversispora epigaea]